MDVTSILATAKQAVDDAEIPDDLRIIAFGKAIDLLSGAEVITRPGARQAATERQNSAADGAASTGALINQLASQLKLDPDIVGEVFHEQNGELLLAVSPSQLDDTVKSAAEQLALLVTASRQLTGVEEATPQSVIRHIAEDYGKLDRNNFSRTLDKMTSSFQFIGKPRSRSLKLKRSGYEPVARLIKQLAGVED